MRRTVFVFTLVMAFSLLWMAGCAKAPAKPDFKADYDVIVVGGGMGGLSAGAHLASGGLKVLLFEQHHKVGGATTSFSRGEFNFEVALHEMTGGGEGSRMGQMLEEAGVLDKVELIRIPDLYRSIFPGVDITYPGNADDAVEVLSKRWPEEAKAIRKYHDLMATIYEEAMEVGEMYRMTPAKRLATMSKVPVLQPTLFRYLFSTGDEILDDYFESEELKAVISQFWVYYGPPPEDLWAIMMMSATQSYLTDGAWHIKGSSQNLSNAYAERIEELGGKVVTGTRVDKILVENGRAQGVITQYGDKYTSRYVVSNADPFQTFFKLVGEEKTPEKYANKLRSMEKGTSLMGVYLGLDVEPSFWNCTDHEIFYNTSVDPAENYRNMVEGTYDKAATAITFYTNLGDPWYSPPGKSVLVLHAYSDIDFWPEEREAYNRKKKEVAAQLVGLTENVFPGLSEHIVVQEVITPRTLKNFTMQVDGIPYGWNFTVKQGMRLTNDTPINGLYLASSWTNPGHGVSTAQISGYQAAQLIMDLEGGK